MVSLHQWIIGLGLVACLNAVSCGSGLGADDPAQQLADLERNNLSRGGNATAELSNSSESFTGRLARHLHPIVNCVAPSSRDKLVAYFGYDNPEGTTLTIPVGRRNEFLPPPIDRGQPRGFVPGVSNGILSIAFDPHRELLQWHLDGSQAVASQHSPPCVPEFAGAGNAMAVSDSEIALTWSPATDYTTPTARIDYDICISTSGGGCASRFVVAQTTAGGATLASITGLSPNTAYYFVVRARNSLGIEDGNAVEVSTQTCATGQQACGGSCTSLAADSRPPDIPAA